MEYTLVVVSHGYSLGAHVKERMWLNNVMICNNGQDLIPPLNTIG